jgi:cephalosporin hydroxylase
MNLQQMYEDRCNTPSDINEHLPTFVQLVLETNAQHVIELGTRTGVSTAAFLHALEQTGGRLTSCDIDEKPAIGEFEHWEFVQGDDCSPEVLERMVPAEIVFLDTSHFYEDTLRELNVYRHLATRFIVCHDTELRMPLGAPRWPVFPVKRAINEFCAVHGLDWVNHPNCWGLGVIRIPEV